MGAFSSVLWHLLVSLLLFNSPSAICRFVYHGVWTRYLPFLHKTKEPLPHKYTGLFFCTSHVLVPPPLNPTIPRHLFRPSANLIDCTAVHLHCNGVLPSLNIFLDFPYSHGLQCIIHNGLLTLFILRTPWRHYRYLLGCLMMETFQHFHHRSCHHPALYHI